MNPKDSNGSDDDEPKGGNGSPAKQTETSDAKEETPVYKQGKLLIDATRATSDIAHPTDIGLLKQARGKLETMIDVLHIERPHGAKKLRTYRRKAWKKYLA